MNSPSYLEADHGTRIAYHRTAGRGPGVVFLGGFMSDMTGTKATALEAHCRARGRAFLRFDYAGHGASSGAFADGTIGLWLADALAAIDRLTDGPQILIGSSMGGWIALLAALQRPDRTHGLIGIAPAPDFTEHLMWARYDETIRNQIMEQGFHLEPSEYGDEPYTITRALIEDGRKHLLLGAPIALDVPLRLIHGQRDADVPWRLSLDIAERVASEDVEVTLIKRGDHRLSDPADLARLTHTLETLAEA